jgi:hypothetical protein
MGIPRELAQAMIQGGGRDVLQQAMVSRMLPTPQKLMEVAGSVYDPNSGQFIATAPQAHEGPQSSAGKMAADLGVDIATPEGQAAVSALAKAMQKDTNINIDAKPVSGPAATIQSMAPGALADLSQIGASLIDPQSGAVNRQLLATMNVPGLGMAVPGTGGAQLRSAFEGALDTMIRIRTGAAASESEMENQRKTYMPSPLDDDAMVADKLARFDRDLRSALEIAGRGYPGAPTAPTPETTAVRGEGPVDKLLQQGIEAITGAFTGGAEPSQPAAPAESSGNLDFSAEIEAGKKRIEELRRKLGR